MSGRRAAGLMNITRKTLVYRSRRPPQDGLRMRMRELAASRVRFGYRRLTVMLRREAAQPEEARAAAMFLGGALIAATLAGVLASRGTVAWPPMPAVPWMGTALALTAVFLSANLALQYGAARLAANRAAVVMLSEVLFAGASAVVLGGDALSPALVVGGGLIVVAAALAAAEPRHRRH